MKAFLISVQFFLIVFVTMSQEVRESKPEYPGGQKALVKYIREELKYPKSAKKQKIEGRVLLSFVIDTTGMVTDVEVLRGIGGGCDEEARRVIKNIPEKFVPGYQRGRPVRVRMTVPIEFKR